MIYKKLIFLGFLMKRIKAFMIKYRKQDFNVKFREHNSAMIGKKKGNVDSDIILIL
jgi:hypothetical protein